MPGLAKAGPSRCPDFMSAGEAITVLDLENLIGDLRGMARALLSSESNPQSLTPTGLASTALRRAKLSHQDWDDIRWENRAHFFSVLRLTMRHALVDHARRRRVRGGEKTLHLPWDDDVLINLPTEADKRPDAFIALDEALAELRAIDSQLADIIEQFYFLGYSIAEIARFLDVDEKTVDRRLKKARVILKRLMKDWSRET
jgi:RNA polymerase sigma factor (TIGR02999 family)